MAVYIPEMKGIQRRLKVSREKRVAPDLCDAQVTGPSWTKDLNSSAHVETTAFSITIIRKQLFVSTLA